MQGAGFRGWSTALVNSGFSLLASVTSNAGDFGQRNGKIENILIKLFRIRMQNFLAKMLRM